VREGLRVESLGGVGFRANYSAGEVCPLGWRILESRPLLFTFGGKIYSFSNLKGYKAS
jgi:hypothetical protein